MHKAGKVQNGGCVVPHPHVLGRTATRCHVHWEPVSGCWCGPSRVYPCDVAANNAPEEDLNVAVVAERVVDVDPEGGHAFAGPVVNADRLVDRALVALNPADAPGPAQDPDGDSDDDSIDVEGHMNGLTIGERVRLTHRIADRTNMPKIQRLTEKVGRKQLSIMNRPRDLAQTVMTFGQMLMLVAMADWTNMCDFEIPNLLVAKREDE